MQKCIACGASFDAHLQSCPSCGKPTSASLVATLPPSLEPEPGVAGRSPQEFLVAGSILSDRYQVIEFLGQGGMGQVVRAKDRALDQTVALKFLPPHLAADPRAMERVRIEVRMARLVSHPNICRVHDLGTTHGQTFLSMEYIDGEDLSSLLHRVGRLAGDRALEIARELCAGLAAAHAAGVIHRDLKPANIMVDRRGHVRITDFGLALTNEDPSNASEIAGTPAYMAPEQLAGAGATARSDLYSLGLVLYELFTGRRVFSGTTLPELIRQRKEIAIVPPSEFVREIDPAAEATILRCVASNPEQRPQSALDVLTALSGDDPLKAALAAGQTPSPSAVAAAPVHGALKPLHAWLCVAVIAVSMIYSLWNVHRFTILDRLRPPLPPVALEVKAREIMNALSQHVQCRDRGSNFIYNDDAMRVALRGNTSEATVAEQRTILFWHRCSAGPLQPLNDTHVLTLDDPPLGPQEALVVMDVKGQLLQYDSTFEPIGDPRASLAAFLNFAKLAPTNLPAITTDIYTGDVKLDDSVPAKVEAHFSGSRTTLRVVPYWVTPVKPAPMKFLALEDIPNVMIILMILASIPLAIRNIRAGRVDRPHAWRIGLIVFGTFFIGTIIEMHHTWTINGDLIAITAVAGKALYRGFTSVLLYLALEPLVRRAWPEALVSWTRLVSGDARDPMVARDVLLGLTVFWATIGLWVLALILSAHGQLLEIKRTLEPLLGLQYCFAATSMAIATSIRFSLVFLLLLLLVRQLSRYRWLAPAALFAAVLLFAVTSFAQGGQLPPTVFFAGMVNALFTVVLLTRFGLLAFAAMFFFGIVGLLFPDVSRVSEWSGYIVWWQIFLSGLTAAYGLYYSTNRLTATRTDKITVTRNAKTDAPR